jgi:hypothetical protein
MSRKTLNNESSNLSLKTDPCLIWETNPHPRRE